MVTRKDDRRRPLGKPEDKDKDDPCWHILGVGGWPHCSLVHVCMRPDGHKGHHTCACGETWGDA